MKALFGCEESQEMTIAFRELGHIANSCDLQKCSGGHAEWHYQEDIFEVLQRLFLSLDFLGVHPTCKFLTNSGVRWLASKKPREGYEWSDKYQIYINWERYKDMEKAAIFFKSMLSYVKSVGVGYVENPILHKCAMEEYKNQFTPAIKEGEMENEFKELNHYLSELSTSNYKDSGNLWIQFIDKFSAFEKRLLSLPQLKPSDEEIENFTASKGDVFKMTQYEAGYIEGAMRMRDNPESFLTK